ncbi:hypothetical protein HWV62_38745 [Athelia sp. TMB]|nr:hypothetical protein HWV62_15689 [Athelia sp. TMB]KAF7980328.1 hypothetical protein HWV62_38745 [Athelia sp. TMB]
MAANFSTVPVLDYALVSDSVRRPEFISQLQHALINVGFLYLKNPPVARKDVDDLIGFIPHLFALPQEAKDEIRMANSPHFLGWRPGAPDYLRLWGPSQWPEETALPGFKSTMERYLAQVQALGYKFIELLAEAFGLPHDALSQFYDSDELMQHRAKIVKYPVPVDETASDQGVGPHYDAGFLTFLLQASDHPGLQVQNLSGQWIDAPPIPGTFVVNIGKALEFVTQGLARATSHRVLSPSKGSTPRYSVPFFQNISLDTRLADHVLAFPQEVLQLKEQRGRAAATDSVNFTEFDREPSGKVNLIGRVKSHPDVAAAHYPDLFKQFFPNGLPAQASAY